RARRGERTGRARRSKHHRAHGRQQDARDGRRAGRRGRRRRRRARRVPPERSGRAAVTHLAEGGPVIPNFGHGSSCVTGDHVFCFGWVRDHWGDTLGPALVQHVELTAIAVGIGFALAFALGLAAHRLRPIEHPVGIAAALLYTIPSLALFQLLVPLTGFTWTTIEI